MANQIQILIDIETELNTPAELKDLGEYVKNLLKRNLRVLEVAVCKEE